MEYTTKEKRVLEMLMKMCETIIDTQGELELKGDGYFTANDLFNLECKLGLID